MEAPNYYGPHFTKAEYDSAFNNAFLWALGEGSGETPTTAARIYHVKEDSLRQAIYRSKKKQRNHEGVYYKCGGNNKILNEAQEEAIRQYCYEQWEMGLGASHKMVFSAISHLKKVRHIYNNNNNNWLIRMVLTVNIHSHNPLHNPLRPGAGSQNGSRTTKTSTRSRQSQLLMQDLILTPKKTSKIGLNNTAIHSLNTRSREARMFSIWMNRECGLGALEGNM
jgi:hypothetical protein